tara:strand:- start:3030 stop:3506 length:477 start_codon:yes stop_codon:yes gene_type:complete
VAHPKVKISDDAGNTASITGGKLDVNAGLTVEGDIQIGAVEIKDHNSSQRAEVNSDGELLVTAPPATFATVTTSKVTAVTNTNWTAFSSIPGKEVQIQSASTNTDIFYLSKNDSGNESEGIELVPSASTSLPINNLNLLSYKSSAGSSSQYLYITVLS